MLIPVWQAKAKLPFNFWHTPDEHAVGKGVKIIDAAGNCISRTSRVVHKGDEIITCEGNHYRVIKVRGQKAVAEFLGKDDAYLAYLDYFNGRDVPAAAQSQSWGKRPVGIYHTHTDESYLPSDGESSIPAHGGIYDVGDAFAEELRRQGVNVRHYKTPHDPHDALAYTRSRRTAIGLTKHNPVALFDIHRDGIQDPNFYRDNIAGEEVARLRLVVGRQNPKMKTNLDFAKRIMAYVNQQHPRLIREIFMAHGSYNQDLLSTALLIEAGTYTNSKTAAENGIALFADDLPVVLGLMAPKGAASKEAGRSGWILVIWILILTAVGAGAFLIINAGSPQEALEQVKKWFKKATEITRAYFQRLIKNRTSH
ncbi:MAG: stage II sporulation protein P [Peptococcaceae bacterium]|nr:stage II sporulation protein P [Peptococcaceae bacterium]